jgi:hypothetical protein
MNFFKRLFHREMPQPDLATISGDWIGHYEQHHARSRIAATLVQDGARISGYMRDLDTERTNSLYEATVNAGLPPGADERLDEQIRNMVPNAGGDSIIVRSILPTDSVLMGTLNNGFVRFTKSYQGESFHAYEIGTKGISCKTPGHAVEYSGRLSLDRLKITGIWTIYQKEAPRGVIDGGFELVRVVSGTSRSTPVAM